MKAEEIIAVASVLALLGWYLVWLSDKRASQAVGALSVIADQLRSVNTQLERFEGLLREQHTLVGDRGIETKPDAKLDPAGAHRWQTQGDEWHGIEAERDAQCNYCGAALDSGEHPEPRCPGWRLDQRGRHHV